MAEHPVTAQLLNETDRRHHLSMANGSTALLIALQTAHPRITAKLQHAAQAKKEAQ